MNQPKKQAKAAKLLNEAVALHNRGGLEEADVLYLAVLKIMPGNPDALHLRALVATARCDYLQAATLADKAIALSPRVANFYNTAGNALRHIGRLQEARARLEKALVLDRNFALAHHNLALVLGDLGDLPGALEENKKARQIDPGSLEPVMHALHLAMALKDGVAAAEYADKLRPHLMRGDVCKSHVRYLVFAALEQLELGDTVNALSLAEEATQVSPESAEAWIALATIKAGVWDDDGAELAFVHAAKTAPSSESANLALANFLKERQRVTEAEPLYLSWLEKCPDSAAARFGLAGILLARKEFSTGWDLYESRWTLPEHTSPRFMAAPQWSGNGTGRLLLYFEQGLGDTIQMLRFVPQVLERGVDQVSLLVQPPLRRLAESLSQDPRIEVISTVSENSHFDAACPLMSLPWAIGAATTRALAPVPAYLRSDKASQAFFTEKLSSHRGKKLGIVWQGGKAGYANKRRMVPEQAFVPLLNIPGWDFVSLQVGVPPVLGGRNLIDLASAIDDFTDLAAAMSCLDAIVCVDTGPAHLAGALGLRCFTLLPWLHDWRWGLDGGSSYWYPSMKLFRQEVGQSWDLPIRNLVNELRSLAD